MRSITEYFAHDDPECPACHGDGTVCEEHPTTAWAVGEGCCGAAGMACPIFTAQLDGVSP